MRISIALGTYNGERFLLEQLESLARQRLLPCELVISDDASSDQTWQIIARFAERAPFPVRPFRNERNLGWQENFVGAALRCEGEWIAFCDQDDVWLPEKLQRIAECAERYPEVVMIVHSARLATEDLAPTGGKLPDFKRFTLLERLHNPPLFTQLGFATCFRRDLLASVPVELRPCDPNIPDRKLSHDQLITLLANALGSVAYLPDVLAIYRRHGGAATTALGTGAEPRNLGTFLRGLMLAGSERYAFQSEIAARDASFLSECAKRQPRGRAERFDAAADFYRSLGFWLEHRAAVYRADQPTRTRLELVAHAVRSGAYTEIGDGAGLGRKSLLKDMALIALSPLVRALTSLRAIS